MNLLPWLSKRGVIGPGLGLGLGLGLKGRMGSMLRLLLSVVGVSFVKSLSTMPLKPVQVQCLGIYMNL